MIKRIIFDIDGTLITNVNFLSSVENSLKRYGINETNKVSLFLSSIKEYEKTHNSYDKDLYLKFFSEKLSCKLDYNFLEIFFEELKKVVTLNSKNIETMLQSLKDYELVLLSNYFEESQRNRLKEMGIDHYFCEYHGEKVIKPKKEAYFNAAGKYKPNECLIVGDDKILDIDIPKKLGFKTLFINEDGDIKKVEDITLELLKKTEK